MCNLNFNKVWNVKKVIKKFIKDAWRTYENHETPNILNINAWIKSFVKPDTAQKSLIGNSPFKTLFPESKKRNVSIGKTPIYP